MKENDFFSFFPWSDHEGGDISSTLSLAQLPATYRGGGHRTPRYKYLANKDRPWKYQELANVMLDIHSEDEYNDTYGRVRMHQALILRHPEGINISSGRTIYRVMENLTALIQQF